MSRLLIVLVMLASFYATQLVAAEGEIPLSQRECCETPDPAQIRALNQSPQWQTFRQQHGDWQVYRWNVATENPHRAIGPSIPIAGFSAITATNVDAASRQFLQDHADVLHVDTDHIRQTKAFRKRNVWYVGYQQVYQGIPVIHSEIELRLAPDARVMMFGSDYHPAITVDTTPHLSVPEAEIAARAGLAFDPQTDFVTESGHLWILPVKQAAGMQYHLVYEVQMMTQQPLGNWVTFVDAHSGEIIWRFNQVRYDTVSGTVSGGVKMVLPTDPDEVQPFRDERLTISGSPTYTDESGFYEVELEESGVLNAQLRGHFVDVNRQDGADAAISVEVTPGDTVNIEWTNENSHEAERNGFYHTNKVYQWINTIDTSITYLDYSMPCAVNIDNTCNAFWNGTGINFFRAGNGCPNTALIPNVVYHEYGHGINHKVYQEAGAPWGMTNGAMHEGLADVVGCFMEEQPLVGRGFDGIGTHLRNLDNNLICEIAGNQEVHFSGQVIGGAMWDLRQMIGSRADTLHQFARWGTPDDPDDDCVAFEEYMIEVLVADDDNGDVSDGTPNTEAIFTAFNRHGIGPDGTRPMLTLINWLFDDADGNDDGRLDAGETGQLIFAVQNDNWLIVENARATLSTENPDIELLTAEIEMGTIETAAQVDNVDNPFEFFIDPEADVQRVFFTITIEGDNFNESRAFTVETYIGRPSILLVDDDGGDDLEQYYMSALDNIDVLAERRDLDRDMLTLEEARLYDLIIWYTGSEFEETLTAADQEMLAAYLDQGGKLFLTGQGIGVDLVEHENGLDFYTSYLHTEFVVAQYRLPVLRGIPAHPISHDLLIRISGADGGANNQVFPNQIEPINGAEATFYYHGPDQAIGAINYNGDYQLVYFGFGLEAINNAQPQFSTREEVLQEVLDWLEDPSTGVTPVANSTMIPAHFAVSQNVPNPFNPRTSIRYQLPQDSPVSVKIYDSSGRLVRTLVQQSQTAGSYTVSWEGTTDEGQPVASGIYFYRLEAGEFSQTRRMVLLQ